MPKKHFQNVDGNYPLYRRHMPKPQVRTEFTSNISHIDLSNVHMDSFGELNTVEQAITSFDGRAAATISAATGLDNGILVFPTGNKETEPLELLEKKFSGQKVEVLIPTSKCLAVMAYQDYFPEADDMRPLVSQAILAAGAGWCGSFGPGVDGTLDVIDLFGKHEEGNYDMSQMHLLQIAYGYYDELSAEARERLIRVLLATGRIRRPNQDDIVTSGGAPGDWSRAGFIELPAPIIGDLLGIHIKLKRIGETENHILTIHTARYLTNQLLYQRDHDANHDNRRNGNDSPSCTELMLALMRNILRDDFSEYNAKNYQNETRSALLNLCSYAYDHEVRLGARMVLDYISAHIAVSSNDLRRMVPFRRRNEGKNVTRTDGFMDVMLLERTFGGDPMAQRFAILAGNTRAYEKGWGGMEHRPKDWSIKTDLGDGNDAVIDVVSDYRLPFSIHDLFVNDLHRRFFQRLHRVPQDDEEVTGRNCDNHEIYAGSPSYLITAGGSPATYAIDPHFMGIVVGDQAQQLGVAVTTSFMPTGNSAEDWGTGMGARDVIQFSSFSDTPGKAINYGVAPDFACGHRVYLPQWCVQSIVDQRRGKFDFVNKRGADGRPGFYLALLRDGDFTVMEAFDTWLHPELSFEQFRSNVWERNKHLSESGLVNNVEASYTTENGNRLQFVIWHNGEGEDATFGARIVSIAYGMGDPLDSIGDAGQATDQFLRGTVLNSTGEGIIEISNHFLGTKITLDMSDQWHPKRTSETGEVEVAGFNQEVWVDFNWQGPMEGDFFRPFNTIAGAMAAAANGGVIKIMPGMTREGHFFGNSKKVILVAPIGGVTFSRH